MSGLRRVLIFAGIAVAAGVALTHLPPQAAFVLYLCASLGLWLYALPRVRNWLLERLRRIVHAVRSPQNRARWWAALVLIVQGLRAERAAPHAHKPGILHRLVFLVEITVILALAWHVTRDLRHTPADWRLYGHEAEYLTSSAYQAALNLRDMNRIALWQPWLEHGEPLITSPFSFVLNPLSTGPSLVLGGPMGIRWSMVLYVGFAGLGGWFLGRVLGLGSLGRTLLGLLMIGKGYTHGAIAGGFFQLAASQAYMPWIIAGTLATLRFKNRRWPPVLLAVMFTLLFWAGNLWYTLPMLISILGLALVFTIRVGRRWIDWAAWRRLAWAGVLTAGLSAATLLPLWVERDHIDHPREEQAGYALPLQTVIETYYDGEKYPPGLAQTYYHFIAPGWFLALIFLVAPIVVSWKRLWLVGGVLIVFFTLWGAGNTPLFLWLYEHIEFLRHWRFNGRALAVGAFWIGVLVALRVDTLTHLILNRFWRQAWPRFALIAGAQVITLALLVYAAGRAAWTVNRQWGRFGLTERADVYHEESCLDWLLAQHPTGELTAFRFNYNTVVPYLEHHVRLFNIEVAYHAIPSKSTVGRVNVVQALPEYAIAWEDYGLDAIKDLGYEPVVESPLVPGTNLHCVYRRPDGAFSYVFTIAHKWTYARYQPQHTEPVTTYQRTPDRITVWVEQDPVDYLVVAVQELAYPGWTVRIDGWPAQVESIGGVIGVILPPGEGVREVRFAFQPDSFLWGARISLSTSLFCIVYLALPICALQHTYGILTHIFRRRRVDGR